MKRKIRISKSTQLKRVKLARWKDLIAALALVGYGVHADEDYITVELGDMDAIFVDGKEVK